MSIHLSHELECNLITEDQLVDNNNNNNPVFPGSCNTRYTVVLCCPWVLVVESVIYMRGDLGTAEEVAKQLFLYVKFITVVPYRCLLSVHIRLSSGFNMLCTYRWFAGTYCRYTHGQMRTQSKKGNT